MTFSIDAGDLRPIGADLRRPECVLADRRAVICCSDARGGILRITSDGRQTLLGGREGLVPNGIAPLPDGSFLIANVGPEGGVWRMDAYGALNRLDITLEGKPLPEVNFVYVDGSGRLWLSVSSAGQPDPTFTPDAHEGSIVVGDSTGFRRVASGLGWTNELRLTPGEDRLYVNETFGRRLRCFDVAPDGALSNATVIAEFGAGDYPDGMALDAEGGIWVVSIISNRIYRVHNGTLSLVFSDGIDEIVQHLETIFLRRGLKRSDLHDLRTGSLVNNITSVAFGGPDMLTGFIGSLGGGSIWSFRSPIAGLSGPDPVMPLCHAK